MIRWLRLAALLGVVACVPDSRRFELVRCSSAGDAPCLTPRTAANASLTFGVGPDGISGLARVASTHPLLVRSGDNPGARAGVSWRPPLMAMPVFRGVADPATVNPALREALSLGAFPDDNRLFIAVLVLIILAFAWLIVWRLAGDAPAATVQEHGATTRTGDGDMVVEESDPREPHEVTQQTARRTALGR